MGAEVQNNLVLGIAAGLDRNPTLAKELPYFATVQSGSGIVMCAVRTPPYPLTITRSDEGDAVKYLVDDVVALYPDLCEVNGPEQTVSLFANAWSRLSGREARRGMRMRIHEIRRVLTSGSRPPGGLRPATELDAEILTPWVAGFIKDVGVSEKSEPGELVRDRLKNRSLYVWDDGGPVSMAAWSGKTTNGVRVNFVYTPENLRRRGYANACVAALTELLLDEGNKYCCLYTDLANSTSNRIYQQIGYRPVCDVAQYRLSG